VYVNGVNQTLTPSAINYYSDASYNSTTKTITVFRSLFSSKPSLYIFGGPQNFNLINPQNPSLKSSGPITALADFKIYNTRLNNADASNIYNPGIPSNSIVQNNIITGPNNFYNINNANLLYYYPFTSDFYDYKTGTDVSNTTVDSNVLINASGISVSNPNITFTNGYANFGNSTVTGIQIPTTTFSASGGITISFWAKINDISNNPIQRLFQCYSNSISVGTVFLCVFTQQNKIIVSTSGSNTVEVPNYTLINNTDWHHYCITFSSPTSNISTLNVYIDGVKYLTTSISSSFASKTLDRCIIGRLYTTADPYTAPKNTFITQFALFNRELNSTEISFLYNFPSRVKFVNGKSEITPKVINVANGYDDVIYYLQEGDALTAWKNATSATDFANTNYYFNYSSSTSGYFVYHKWAGLGTISGLAYNGSVWVSSVGYEGGFMDPRLRSSVIYSYDGILWNASTISASSNSIVSTVNGIDYGYDKFVAVGTGSNKFMYSYDGISWVAGVATGVFSNVTPMGVVYKNSTWVAYGKNTDSVSRLIATSKNGITWTEIYTTGNFINKQIFGLDYNNFAWVAVGDSSTSTNIAYSYNLFNWFSGGASFSSYGTSVKWANNKFVAIGYNSTGVITTSRIGTNWLIPTIVPISNTMNAINYDSSNSVWFIASGSKICYSTDNAVTWAATNSIAYKILNIKSIYDNNDGFYPCFLEGSKILTLDPETDEECYVPIETLRPGNLIKTFASGYKAVYHIGKKTILNPPRENDIRNKLYKFPKSKINGMTDDLYITGEHCTLHNDNISSELKEQVKEHMGDIYITEYQYRVPACIDNRAVPYNGKYPVTIWHIALENDNYYRNYGVYANGLLVETCSIQYLIELSNMEIV
jgi:hypothetical protein